MKWTLSNVVLYAKGWYTKTEDVVEDLKKILELDNYTPFTLGDVFYILTSEFERFEHNTSKLTTMLIGIHPEQCWKINYKFEEGKYNLQKATIYYILSILRFLEREDWNIKRPDYSNKSLRPKDKTDKILTRFFGEL